MPSTTPLPGTAGVMLLWGEEIMPGLHVAEDIARFNAAHPDIAVRHYVLQGLGLMWAVCFSLAIGSYTFLAASIVGHTLLIGAAAITVAVLSTAAARPQVFARLSGRRHDGEHD